MGFFPHLFSIIFNNADVNFKIAIYIRMLFKTDHIPKICVENLGWIKNLKDSHLGKIIKSQKCNNSIQTTAVKNN